MPQSHLILYLEQKIMTSFYYLGIQKISKIILYLLFKKKKPKPVQTDWFRFGSVQFFRTKTSSNQFGSVFFCFFRFGFDLVFSVLGL